MTMLGFIVTLDTVIHDGRRQLSCSTPPSEARPLLGPSTQIQVYQVLLAAEDVVRLHLCI